MNMNMKEMMKQAQALQKKLQDFHKEMEITDVEGTSGGGMVKVTMTAKGDIRNINIDDSLMTEGGAPILVDLLLAAIKNAKSNADAKSAQRMSELGLPSEAMF
jgi:DNA-binding YbaB/EbfC family protein